MSNSTSPLPDPTTLLSDEYRETIETASLDWQVAQYIRALDRLTIHSSEEIKAAAIAVIARRQHGAAFDEAVANYR